MPPSETQRISWSAAFSEKLASLKHTRATRGELSLFPEIGFHLAGLPRPWLGSDLHLFSVSYSLAPRNGLAREWGLLVRALFGQEGEAQPCHGDL